MKLVIDVKVKDLSRAVDFYTNKLGFLCRTQENDWASILVGDAEIHLYLNGGVTSGVEFYVDDVDAEVIRLKNKGVVFINAIDKPSAKSIDENSIVTFPWGRTAFFEDSEGNELALVKDFD